KKNFDTNNFYDSMPIGTLNKYAQISGLSNGPELLIPKVLNEIKNSKSIMEIGAGEGRVIDNLLKLGYKNKIIGIERSKNFYELLKKKYHNEDKIIILQKDFLSDELPKVQLGLFLWAEICNQNEKDQINIIKKLSTNLETLIVDSIIMGEESNATSNSNNKFIFEMEWGKLEGQITSPQIILKSSKKYFKNCQTWEYITDNSKKRRLYLLKK
ncbi:MAG: hypothetical protein KC589_10720, partial [Nanoarchaeota archaeon]|nr:hypothetical protein [Nanoarchaeota archaeon]